MKTDSTDKTKRVNWPCWIRHDWEPWDAPKKFGFLLYQDKRCRKCGKTKQRECGWASNK